MGRSPCCEKGGLKKGPWTPEEDQRLLTYIEKHGYGCWRALPAKAGLQRCGKSCRLRWTNYLRPGIKRGMFSVREEQTIVQLHALLGNRWSVIASHLPKRTDNEIKNFWNTHLKRRLAKMGIDPVTHRPTCDTLSAADSHTSRPVAAHLSHLAQWESARLEAEVRLARESKLLRFASSTSFASAHSTATFCVPSATTPFQLPLLSSVPQAPIELHNASTAPALPSCSNVLKAWEGVWKRSTRASVVGGQSSQDAKIDLESPTSTLSFSGSVVPLREIGLVDHHHDSSSSVGQQAGVYGDGSQSTERGRGEMEGQQVDRKYFLKPIQLFDTKKILADENLAAASFTAEYSSSALGTNSVSSWLHEWLKMGPSSAAASSDGHFADGFTEILLLNNSEEENSAGGWAAELAVTKSGKGVNV